MATANPRHRIGEEIVRLVRTERFQSGVRGVLYLPTGISLHTLESHSIAPGSYFLNPDDTGRFRNWIIENDLGTRSASHDRKDVEIHEGNALYDTAGCILLGCGTTKHGIGRSRDAIDMARAALERNDEDPPIWVLNISEAL